MFGGDACLLEAWRTSIGLKGFNRALCLCSLINLTGEVSILSKDNIFLKTQKVSSNSLQMPVTVTFIGAEAA